MKTVNEVVVALRRLVADGESRRDLAATVTMEGLGFSGCYTNGMGMPMLEDMHPGLKPMRGAGSRRGLALADESGEPDGGSGDGPLELTDAERALLRRVGMDERVAALPETANFHDWKRHKAAAGGRS